MGQVLHKVEEYCAPEDKDVTHGRVYFEAELKFHPICGRRTLCPRKEGDCPPGFLDGKIGGYCVEVDTCGAMCGSGGGSPDDIHPRVLVTLIG